MDTIYRVFVSSTFEDLKEERKAVTQALLEMECFPAGMELFQASDDSQWELIKKVIDSCDYYIIIVAGCYGTVHKDFNKSYTQMEFEYAVQAGIPILGFIHKNIDGLPANKIDDIKRVKEFIEILKTRPVRFWSDAKELSGMVSWAMYNAIKP